MQRNKLVGLTKLVFAGALLLTTAAWGGQPAAAATNGQGAVYALTNAATGNAVAIYDRAPDGALTPAGMAPTGGLGTGAGLGSQGALAFSDNGRWLFAVNAGSNDISVLRVAGDGLTLVGRTASGGAQPISLTVHGDLLYVLNAGSDAITGFHIGPMGDLAPVAGSTRPLSGANVGAAQVAFAPGGRALVVTEKNTNNIDTYTVDRDGQAEGPAVYPSAGATPFGFAFARRDTLIVSDAAGGAPNAGALSSYTVAKSGALTVATALGATHQTAPCWVATSGNGRYAYTTNAGSGTISGFAVDEDGALSPLNSDGRTGVIGPTNHPIDLGFSAGSRYLYALLTGATPGIAAFRVAGDGSLTALPGVTGLTAAASGLVAR
jgi:6-phosphogluconolactonase